MRAQSEDILIFTHEFYPKTGGISSFVQEIVKAATGAGNTITVIAPASAHECPDAIAYSVDAYPALWWRSSLVYRLIKYRRT